MGKPRQPAAPDPVALANAQANANTQTATQQQRLNMIGTQGPQGSTSYVADPSQPGGYRQVTSLSPGEQANYDRSTGVYGSALQTAQDQIGRVNTALGQGLNTQGLPELQGFNAQDFDRQRYEDAAYQSATRQLDPRFDRMERSQDARLAAQGLGANSEATRNLRQAFERDRTDAYGEAQRQSMLQGGQEQSRAIQNQIAGSTFGNQARTQGLQERAYVQNQPLQQLQALLGTGQVGMPQGVQYTPTSVGQTDVLGANALSLNQQNQNYAQRAQQQQALMGGLFQLGGAAIGASDRRLKRDIKRVGTLANGLPVYEYRYVWGLKRHVGVMAQDVLKAGIDAVVRHWTGFLMVDYGKLV
jgi:Chaperone of endosialidase